MDQRPEDPRASGRRTRLVQGRNSHDGFAGGMAAAFLFRAGGERLGGRALALSRACGPHRPRTAPSPRKRRTHRLESRASNRGGPSFRKEKESLADEWNGLVASFLCPVAGAGKCWIRRRFPLGTLERDPRRSAPLRCGLAKSDRGADEVPEMGESRRTLGPRNGCVLRLRRISIPSLRLFSFAEQPRQGGAVSGDGAPLRRTRIRGQLRRKLLPRPLSSGPHLPPDRPAGEGCSVLASERHGTTRVWARGTRTLRREPAPRK